MPIGSTVPCGENPGRTRRGAFCLPEFTKQSMQDTVGILQQVLQETHQGGRTNTDNLSARQYI